MKRIKKIIGLLLISILFLVVAAPVFSVDAVVQSLKGKVELKSPGGTWQKAERGMRVALGSTISTGFNSSAEILIGNSILKVKPLTRMDLEELIEKEGTINTTLHLRVGKVKADVRSTEGLQNNFKLRSPQSTAAVRGTVFEYDGYSLKVENGTVVLSNRLGQIRLVGGGQQSGTDGLSVPENVVDMLTSDFEVDLSSVDEEDVAEFIIQQFPEYATIVFNLYWDLGGL